MDQIQEMSRELKEISAGLSALRVEVASWLATSKSAQERLHDLDRIVRGDGSTGFDKRLDRLEQRRLVLRTIGWAAVIVASASGGAVLNYLLE